MGTQNLEKLARNARISCSSGQGSVNWVDFVQFTINFESSIYHGAKREMVCKFCIICMNCGFFSYLRGVHGFFNCVHVRKWYGFCVIHNLT